MTWDESFRKPSEQILRATSRPGKASHHQEASLAWRSGNCPGQPDAFSMRRSQTVGF